MGDPVYQHHEDKLNDLVVLSSGGEQMDLPHLLYQIAEFDERKAFSIFFKHYHTKMLSLANIFVSSPQVAEDIVSEVLIKLLRNRKKTFHKKNFLGFLYTCIKNQALDYIRVNKKHKHMILNNNIDFLIQHKSKPCNDLVSKEFEEIIASCIEDLPPKRKLVYKLIKDDGLSYKQVAALLDISVRTVEVQLRFAVRHIKIIVDDYLNCKG